MSIIKVDYGEISEGVTVDSVSAFNLSTTGLSAISIPTTKKAKGIVMHYVNNGTYYELIALDGSNSNHPFWTYNTFYDDAIVTYNDTSINISKNPGNVTWSGFILY
jgi:hypothetical protein